MVSHKLVDKRCIPCEGGTPPLTHQEIESLKLQLKLEWEVEEDQKMRYKFKFKDFAQSLAFVNKVAEIAQGENHHPDIHIHYNKVLIELWTHSIGGLSENDFIVAAKVEELV